MTSPYKPIGVGNKPGTAQPQARRPLTGNQNNVSTKNDETRYQLTVSLFVQLLICVVLAIVIVRQNDGSNQEVQVSLTTL